MTEPEQDRTTPAPISQARYRAALDAHAETLPPGVETRLRAMRREAVEEASRGRLRPFLWGGLASAAALILALTTTLESERGGGAAGPVLATVPTPGAAVDEVRADDDLALARELDLIEDLEFALWLALEGGDEGFDAG